MKMKNTFEKTDNLHIDRYWDTANSLLPISFIILNPCSKRYAQHHTLFFLHTRNYEFAHVKTKDILSSHVKPL